MKAGVSSPEGLVLRDIPQPVPKPNEVLTRVKACGLNRADLSAAKATFGHGVMGAALGLEWAGEVAAVGADVKDFKPGDRVVCSGSGGYAEYAVSDHGRTLPLPAGFSFEQAAVLPVALHTLHNALVTQGRLKAGESVLIQGASSGVGLMGLQIARMKGAKPVMGAATNDARRARLKEFGADLAIDTRDEKWPDQVLEATGGKGVNLTVDLDGRGHQRCAARAAEGIRRRSCDRHARREMARSGARGDRRQGREPDRRYGVGVAGEPDHESDRRARPHRQRRAARRRDRRVQFRPARHEAHRLQIVRASCRERG